MRTATNSRKRRKTVSSNSQSSAEIVEGETRGTLQITTLELADKGNYYCKVTYDSGVKVDSITGTLEIYCKFLA